MKRPGKAAIRFIAHRTGRLGYLLSKASRSYLKTYNNLNYDMATNGEQLLLERLSAFDIRTVFDVGANRGDYTHLCLSRFPNATVHAFEIVPATFQKLQAACAHDVRVKANSVGLSNVAGSLDINININDNADGVSSLVVGPEIRSGNWRKLEVQVTTGDEYCSTHSVSSIDLLKVDVEGAEHLVLDGLRDMLREKRIAVIQFEFGMANIYSKFLLNDYFKLLGEYGFVMGPLMPSGVAFKPYHPRDENFQGPPNFVAVQADRADLIEALRLS